MLETEGRRERERSVGRVYERETWGERRWDADDAFLPFLLLPISVFLVDNVYFYSI